MLTGAAVATGLRIRAEQCGGGIERIADPVNPLMDPALMKARPEERRDRLVESVRQMPAPFGRTLAGVDYNYEQWLRLYGVQGGVLAWTKRNAPVTMLSASSMEPTWALRPATKRVAWDASGDTFLLLGLSRTSPTEVSNVALGTGRQRWCSRLATTNEDGAPIATAVLPDGSVVVAAQRDETIEVERLAADDGERLWRVRSGAADRADHLGLLTEDLLVVGGREAFRLGDPRTPLTRGAAIAVLRLDDGKVHWTYSPPDRASVHVVGADAGRLVVLERDGQRTRLFALDDQGREQWSVASPEGSVEAIVRGGAVVVESRSSFHGLSVETGRRLWKWKIPKERTFIPYGFTLAQMPSVDAGHLLMPTTTDLRILDVTTGSQRIFPLPTDGINTTYWPYQLVATDQVLGVVTNTGAVVVERDP